VALAGQTAGGICVVLDFFAPLFVSRQKVERRINLHQRKRRVRKKPLFIPVAFPQAADEIRQGRGKCHKGERRLSS
jgi:hypothetical protein